MSTFLRFVAVASAAVTLLFVGTVGARAADCDIILDVSGSMSGFKNARQGQYAELLDRLQARCEGSFVFGDGFGAVRGPLRNQFLNNQNTRLDIALNEWERLGQNGRAAVFVTDNIADVRDTQADPQESFYAKLFEGVNGVNQSESDPTFDRITVVATRLSFAGRIYSVTGGPTRDYSGMRALAVYILGVETTEADFNRLEQNVVDILSGLGLSHRSVRTRPFAGMEVNSSPIEEIAFESSDVQSAVNLEIIESEGDRILFIGDRDFSENVTLPLDIWITPGDDWVINKATFEALWKFEENEETASIFQYQDSINAMVTPGQADLVPGAPVKFDLEFELESMGYFEDITFWEMLSRAWSGTDIINGSFVVRWTVEESEENQNPVSIAGDFRDDWSLPETRINELNEPSEEVQSRIFRLDDVLVEMVPPDQLRERVVQEYPIRVEVVYPSWPAYILIFFILLLMALAAFFLRQIFKTTEMMLSASDAEDRRVKFSPFGEQGAVGTNGMAIRVRNCLLFFLVTSTGSVTRGRILGLAGGEITVAPRGRSSMRMPAVGELLAAFGNQAPSDEDDWEEPEDIDNEFDDDLVDTFELRPVEGEEDYDDNDDY